MESNEGDEEPEAFGSDEEKKDSLPLPVSFALPSAPAPLPSAALPALALALSELLLKI